MNAIERRVAEVIYKNSPCVHGKRACTCQKLANELAVLVVKMVRESESCSVPTPAEVTG